jgi:hypothetical protein
MGDSPGDCWEWIGSKSKVTGYGKKQWHGETWLAHRWIYTMLFGKIEDSKVINHLCGNRLCVNPHHLEVTDQAGNCRHGGGAKLTADAVKEIKSAGPSRKWGDGAKLARKHGVSCALIHDIWNGRAWANISHHSNQESQ